jgi:hypothetical protein
MVKQRLYFVLTLKHTILSSTIEQKALTILYFQTRTHPNERPNVRRERPNDVAKLRLSSFSEPRVHWSIFMQSHWSTRTIKWPYLVMLTTLPSMDKAHASGGKVLPLYSKTFSQGKPSLHVAISFPEPAILGSQARGTRLCMWKLTIRPQSSLWAREWKRAGVVAGFVQKKMNGMKQNWVEFVFSFDSSVAQSFFSENSRLILAVPTESQLGFSRKFSENSKWTDKRGIIGKQIKHTTHLRQRIKRVVCSIYTAQLSCKQVAWLHATVLGKNCVV